MGARGLGGGVEAEPVVCSSSLREALACLPAGSAPVVHTDGGACYRTGRWKSALAAAGATRSMSRKGTCPDNARAEGFFGTLKQEFLYGREWAGVGREEFEGLLSGYMVVRRAAAQEVPRGGPRALRDPGRAQEEARVPGPAVRRAAGAVEWARTGTRFLPQSLSTIFVHDERKSNRKGLLKVAAKLCALSA